MSSKILSNSIYYTTGKIMSIGVSFIMLPIYTIYLSPYDYGIINSMLVIQAFLMILFTLAIENSIFRLYHDYKTVEQKKLFFGTITILIFFISSLSIIILYIFRTSLSKIFSDIPFSPYFILAIITAYLSVFRIIPGIYLVVEEKGKQYFFLGLIQLILGLVLSIIYVIILNEKALGVLKANLISSIVLLPLYIRLTIRNITFHFNTKIAKDVLKYSLPFIPMVLGGWILTQSDRIFIANYFSQSEVGIYSLGYKITGIYIMLITSIRMAYNPVFFRLANDSNQEYAKKKLEQYHYYYFLGSIILVFLITFFGKEAIGLLLNIRYYDSWIILSVLAYATFFPETASLFNMSIYQNKKTYYMISIILVSAFTNIILNFLLVPRWSMYGASIATLISAIIMFFLLYYLSEKVGYRVKIRWKKLSYVFFSGLIFNSIFWLIQMPLIVSLIIKIFLMLLIFIIIFHFKFELKRIYSRYLEHWDASRFKYLIK